MAAQDPMVVDLKQYHAQLAEGLQKCTQAIADAQKVLATNPGDADAQQRLDFATRASKSFQAAQLALEASCDHYPVFNN